MDIVRCRQRQVAVANKVGKHGFCCRYPVNLGAGGDIPRDTDTHSGQSRSFRCMAVALYVSFDVVFPALPKAKMHIACLARSLVSCIATCEYIMKITTLRQLKETASPTQMSFSLAHSQGCMPRRIAISTLVAPFT